MTELEREQLKLNSFLEKFGELIEKEEELLNDITPLYREDPLHYTHVYNDIKGRLGTLSKAIKNPFFGRIIFDVEGQDLTHDIYIGRVGIQDEKGKAITVDWRAPITSLYYDSELGRTSYEVLDKKIYGELKLKRQFEIENGIITHMQEKPLEPKGNIISLAAYIYPKSVLRIIDDYLSEGNKTTYPGYFVEYLYKVMNVNVYLINGNYYDGKNPESIKLLYEKVTMWVWH